MEVQEEEEEEEEEVEEVTIEGIAERINNLELQVRALDVNIESFTNEVKVLNRNLMGCF